MDLFEGPMDDPNRLAADDDTNVFEDEEDAVKEIFDAVDEGEITNTDILDELENIIANKILVADEILCQTAIDDAVDDGGNPEDIGDAEYNELPMPNLRLNPKEVDALIQYMDEESLRVEKVMTRAARQGH